MADFRHRIVLVKASGLGPPHTLEAWRRFLSLCEVAGITLTAGLEPDRLAGLPPHARTRVEATLAAAAASVWNQAEPTQPPTRRNPKVARPVQSSTWVADGSGLSLMNRDGTVRRLDGIHPCSFGGAADVGRVLRAADASRDQALLLEVEPGKWSEETLIAFERLIADLLDRNYQFLTADDYIEYQQWTAASAWPTLPRAYLAAADEYFTRSFDTARVADDAPSKAFADFYFTRFRRGTAHLWNLYQRIGWDAVADAAGLDIGTGAGNWAVAYTALGPHHTMVGLDSNRYLVDSLHSLVRGTPVNGRLSFTEGSAHELPFADASFGHVTCYNTLNYLDAELALAQMARVLQPDGQILLGVQTDTFYLRSCYDALVSGNLEEARRRIDSLGQRAARNFGLVGGPSYSATWPPEALLAHIGAHGLVPDPPELMLRERNQYFLGRPLFTTMLLRQGHRDNDPRSIFRGGGRERFLLSLRANAETDNPNYDWMTVAAAATVRGRDQEPPGFTAAAERRLPAFTRIVRAYRAADYRAAADELRVHAERTPTHPLLIMTAVAAHSARDLAAAQTAIEASPRPQRDWTDDDWYVYLMVSMSDTPLADARRAFSSFLLARWQRKTGVEFSSRAALRRLSAQPIASATRSEAEMVSIAHALQALGAA